MDPILINAIGTLAGALDSLNRAGDAKGVAEVSAKLLQLVGKL